MADWWNAPPGDQPSAPVPAATDTAPPTEDQWWNAPAAPPATPPETPQEAGTGRAPFMHEAARAASFGLGDVLAAGSEAASGKLINLVSPGSYTDTFAQQYEQARQRRAQQAQQYRTAEPVAAGTADVLGSLATALPAGQALQAISEARTAAPMLGQLDLFKAPIQQGSRLIYQGLGGGALGAAGGATQAALDPNATLPGIIAGTVAGAGAGAATALPGLVPAASKAGMSLTELAERAYKASVPLAGGEYSGHPLIGMMLAAPGAAKSAIDVGKALGNRVPAWGLPFAPGLGGGAGSVASYLAQPPVGQ
jgi:hypothetical protein